MTTEAVQALERGVQHHQHGEWAQAEALYRYALQQEPTNAQAFHLLGVLASQSGRYDQAITLIQRAIAFDATNADFYNNLGIALAEHGDCAAAIGSYREALRLQPAHAEALYNLGTALQKSGDLPAAIASYYASLQLNPHHAEVYNNLGQALYEQGDAASAIASYQLAFSLRPDYAEALSNCGIALRTQGNLAAATASFRQALQCMPEFTAALKNLSVTLEAQGNIEEALACSHEGLRLLEADSRLTNQGVAETHMPSQTQQDYVDLCGNVMHQMLLLCDWSEYERNIERIRQAIKSSPATAISPFLILNMPTSPAEQLACARQWVTRNIAPFSQVRDSLAFTFAPASKERLRIGYLSADFRFHAVGLLVAELFELHNRDCVDVIAYSLGPDDHSPVRARIAAAADSFVDLSSASYVDAAKRIYDDGVDILVDLMGHTGGSRPHILALRPAPIQVTALAGTIGADFVDYFITDRVLTPPDQQPFFAESFAYLPHSFQPNDRQRPIAGRTPSRQECGLPEEGFVFCSFTTAYKVTPHVFAVWMRLLNQTPGSVLWLSVSHPVAQNNLRREAAACAVDPDRLVFAPKLPDFADHLARYRCADLVLDTFPFGGHTTASDVLWAGVPLLTCAGQTFVSRVGASLLTAIGLPELIASSLDEYEARALHLAHHPGELSILRHNLAANRDTMPLFDSPAYTRDLEQVYRQMWQTLLP